MFKKGFTLVEILIVVVILASVVAFGVPSYRKAQVRARFNAALGTLTQLGGGINNLYSDIQTYSGNSWTYSANDTHLTNSSWTSDFNTDIRELSLTRWGWEDVLPTSLNWNQAFILSLVVREYMPPLKLTGGSSEEMIPYNHYICKPDSDGEEKFVCNGADYRKCCKHNTNHGGTVACMLLAPSHTSKEEMSYVGARFYRDGTYNVLSCDASDPDEDE